MLIDEMCGTSSAAAAGEAAMQAASREVRRGESAEFEGGYSSAALATNQPPVTCLIPRRKWTLLVLWLSGLSAVAGIETLYANVYLEASRAQHAALTALDVTSRGSLMSWFSSLLFLAAAVGSIMVYALRRHRLDDYRGQYRLWLWAALLCVVASADLVTGLHVSLASLLTDVLGAPWHGDARIWWMGVVATALGLGLLGFWLEMSRSLAARASLLIATAGYMVSALVELGFLLSGGGTLARMAQSTCLMVAHLHVALAVACYCRSVYRRAQGGASVRRPRRQVSKQSPPRARAVVRNAGVRESRSQPIRFDAAHELPSAVGRSSEPSSAPGELAEDETLDDVADDAQKPSKAERRRLRKQMRQQNRAESSS